MINCDQTVRRCWVGVVYSERKLARVFFIDHGEWADIPLQRLFWLPEFVTAFPLQVLPCVIPGWLQREKGLVEIVALSVVCFVGGVSGQSTNSQLEGTVVITPNTKVTCARYVFVPYLCAELWGFGQ